MSLSGCWVRLYFRIKLFLFPLLRLVILRIFSESVLHESCLHIFSHFALLSPIPPSPPLSQIHALSFNHHYLYAFVCINATCCVQLVATLYVFRVVWDWIICMELIPRGD